MLPPECVFADASRQHMRRAIFGENVSQSFSKGTCFIFYLFILSKLFFSKGTCFITDQYAGPSTF